MCDISPSLSDCLHSVWYSLGPSMLPQMALLHSFQWLSKILRCVYVPRLLYAFFCWWTFSLLPCLGYWHWKRRCSEHWSACILLNHVFPWTRAQEWDCRVIRFWQAAALAGAWTGWAGGANQGRLHCRQCSWNRTTSTGRAQPRGVPCALLPVGMTWHVNLGHRAPDQCKPSSKRSEKILNTYSRDTRFAGWQKKPSGCLSWFDSLREALCMCSELGGYLAGRIRRKQGEFKNVPEG